MNTEYLKEALFIYKTRRLVFIINCDETLYFIINFLYYNISAKKKTNRKKNIDFLGELEWDDNLFSVFWSIGR